MRVSHGRDREKYVHVYIFYPIKIKAIWIFFIYLEIKGKASCAKSLSWPAVNLQPTNSPACQRASNAVWSSDTTPLNWPYHMFKLGELKNFPQCFLISKWVSSSDMTVTTEIIHSGLSPPASMSSILHPPAFIYSMWICSFWSSQSKNPSVTRH